MGDYICKMKNGGVSYDISDAVADIEVVKGKNVRFVNVQVYVYKYMWTSSSFWLSNVKVEGGSIISASDIPTLNDNSTLISVDSYGGKYEDLILKQSSSSGDYYVLECYTQATSLVNTTLGAISPSIQITQKGQWFTFQLVDPDGTSEDSGWHAEPNFGGSGYPRGVTLTNDTNNNPIEVKVVPVFNGEEGNSPSNRKTHANGDPVVWTQRVYISKTYTAIVNGKNKNFIIKYVADFDFQAYSKTGSSWFNTRYNSSDNTTITSDSVKVIKPSNYIEGSDEAVLEYIAMKGAGYSDIAMDIGYSYIPAPENIMKMYSDSREIVNREIVAAFSSGNVAKLREKPNQTASSEELQVALTNLFDIRGVCRYSPTVRLNLTANCDQALKAVCALTNRDGYFTDKAYFVNGIVNWLGYYRYYNKDDGKLYVKRQELSADEPRADPSTAVKLLQLDYHDNSYYKDRANKKHPVDWVTDSRSTDVGSENLISIQKVSYSGGSCTFKIANPSNTSEGTEIVYDYPMDVDSETGKAQLTIIGLNSVVRSSTGSAAFQFAVMENTAAEGDAYTYKATFYPYCPSPDKLPKGADYENTYAVIHDDTPATTDDLYKCTKNANNEYVYTMVTPHAEETCLITNPPYTGVWTFNGATWVMGTLSPKEVTRSALFTDYTVFEKVRDLQTTAYNGDDYASASNLQLSYVKLSYPACTTQYYIGNLTLTDTEQILSDLKSSASASINQNVISSAISDQSSSQIVVGNRQSVDVSSAGIKDSAFSGFIMKKNASASSANFTGYSNGTKQIRINSDGVLSCGTYFNNKDEEVGDAVILDKNGLRTYSYEYVDSSTSSTDYDYYKYTLQCEVNTKGELIAGANTYKLDAAGLSYNFPAKGWGTLLYYDDNKKKTVLNGSIYVKDAQIDSLSADKITSGTLNASTSIQVGTGENIITISGEGTGSITGSGFTLNKSGLALTKGSVSIGNDVVLNSAGLKGYGFLLNSSGLTLSKGVVSIGNSVVLDSAGLKGKGFTLNSSGLELTAGSVTLGNDVVLNSAGLKGKGFNLNSSGLTLTNGSTIKLPYVEIDDDGLRTYNDSSTHNSTTLQCRVETGATSKTKGAFYAGASTYLDADGLHGVGFDLTSLGLTLVGSGIYTGSIDDKSATSGVVAIDSKGIFFYEAGTSLKTAQAGSLADATAYITSDGKVMGLAIDSVETGNVKDNAITSSKIESLVADKIVTGVLKAKVGISSEGNICAGLYSSGAYAVKLDTGGVTTYDSNGTIQCKITTSGTNGGAFYAGASTYLNATGLHGQDFNLTDSGLTLTGGSIEMPYVVIDNSGLKTYSSTTHDNTTLQCRVGSDGKIRLGTNIYLDRTGIRHISGDFQLSQDGLTIRNGIIESPIIYAGSSDSSGNYSVRINNQGISIKQGIINIGGHVIIDVDGLTTYSDATIHDDTTLQCNVDSTGQILAGQGTVRMGSEGFRVYDAPGSSANILVRASNTGFATYVDNTEEGSRSALSVVHRPTSAILFDISSYKGSIYGDTSSNTNAIDIHVPSDSVLNASTGGAITSNTLRIYKTPWQTSSGQSKEYVFSEGSYPGDSVVSSLGEHTSHGITDQNYSASVDLNNKSYTSLRSAMTEVNSGAETILNVANGAMFSAEVGDHCRFESTFSWAVPGSLSGASHIIPGDTSKYPKLKFTVKSLATMDYHVKVHIAYKDAANQTFTKDIGPQESQVSIELSSHYITALEFTFYTEFDVTSDGHAYGEKVYFYNAYFEYTPADAGSEIRVWDDHLSLCGATHILGRLVGNFETDDTAQTSIKKAIESIYPKATSFFSSLPANVTSATSPTGGYIDLPNCRICFGYVQREGHEKYPSDGVLSTTFAGGFKYPPIMTVCARDAGSERNYPITVYTVSKSGFCFTTRSDYAGINYIAIGEKP